MTHNINIGFFAMNSTIPSFSLTFLSTFAALFICCCALSSLHFDEEDAIDFFQQDRAEDVTTEMTKTTAKRECKALSKCNSHGDCGGTDGKFEFGMPNCMGGAADKCNCIACKSGILGCKNDAKCGGLQGSCDTTTGICNCIKAAQAIYEKNTFGFSTFGAAIDQFCNKDTCEKHNCFGLPCIKGREGKCLCPPA